ncbi:hypothetical protein [Halorubrum persicum]|uniref:hypothetical protein n=1 Tax=Halorubrum persicum TaxID=1383844 RepID=UPI00118177D9|nr:hypothetical protein [Halorubrum persicum]
MNTQPITSLLVDDDRAVAPVIGVVILFGFLILTLSVYQVEVVPQQNAETEFQHSGEVRNDLVELRASILQAGSIDQPQYQTVQLGTTYSTRTFSINPPAPAGTLRTTQSYPITISNGSGTPDGTITIPTRFIQYRPGYNELDRSPTWYDASVLYVDARGEGGGIAVIEDQALVDGRDVQITAVQREFQRSGTGRVTLELRPAQNVTGEIPTGDLTVTIPTRLNESDWESKTDLPTNSSVYVGVTDTDTDGVGGFNIYNLTLNTTPDRLTVDTVGVQQDPDEPTQNDAASIPDGSGSDGGTDGGDGGTDGGDGGSGSQPSFTSLTASVDDYNKGQDAIRDISVSGTVDNVDSNGDIEIELTDDSGTLNSRRIPMAGSFDEAFNTGSGNSGPSNVGVTVRLLDAAGDAYVTCTSDSDLTNGDSELTLNDFTCN